MLFRTFATSKRVTIAVHRSPMRLLNLHRLTKHRRRMMRLLRLAWTTRLWKANVRKGSDRKVEGQQKLKIFFILNNFINIFMNSQQTIRSNGSNLPARNSLRWSQRHSINKFIQSRIALHSKSSDEWLFRPIHEHTWWVARNFDEEIWILKGKNQHADSRLQRLQRRVRHQQRDRSTQNSTRRISQRQRRRR